MSFCSTPFGIKEGCALRLSIRCSTPFGIKEGFTLALLLNAFRHQRGLHTIDLLDECSTPFGIKEGCTVPV